MSTSVRRLTAIAAANRATVMPYIALIILLAVISLLRPGFGLGSAVGLRGLATEAAVFTVVALGQTLVIVSGGIDLSVPWVLNGSAILLTYLTAGEAQPLIWVIPLLMVLGFGVGAVSGSLISILKVSPVVITLGMNVFLAGAIAGIIQGNAAGKYGETPQIVTDLVRARTLDVPHLMWISLILVGLMWILMSRTPFGRRVYAVGTNSTVALLSGVRPRRLTVVIYGISSLMSTVAGILIAGKLGSVTLGIGEPYLFTSVAVVAIGGASILGGSGNVIGTFGGACLLAVATAAIPVLGVPIAFTFIVFGLIILAAVTVSTSGRLVHG